MLPVASRRASCAVATALVLAGALAAAGAPGAAGAADLSGWGADVNTGSGPALIDAHRPALAAIVRASPAERPALISEFVESRGLAAVEVVKRFRNPELGALHLALLGHADWRVRHRALFALEYGGGPPLPKMWELARSEPARLREKAVISLVKLWEPKAGAAALGGDPAAAVQARRIAEPDPFVRACLDVLSDRIAGKAHVERVSQEYVRTDPDGLRWTPFLEGMDGQLATVAPGWVKKGVSKGGGGDAAKLGPSLRWTTPLLGFGDEEVKGTSLQPFANLRANGTVHHTGLDVGACLDGAGFYAAADGFVRWVLTGTDMGTLMVLQHSADGKDTVNAVYMHGGDTVFVTGGDRVRAGQLLGTMGMSYSIENGGHFAHLHYGLYPGGFSETHNYGYKPVSAGLADWIDPARFIPFHAARTRPFAGPLRPADPAFAKAVEAIREDAFGRAWAEIEKVTKAAGATDAQRADGQWLSEQIEAAVDAISARAADQRAAGWPDFALRLLQRHAADMKNVPAASKIAADAASWPKDPTFLRAQKAEDAFELACAKAAKMTAKKEPAGKVREVFTSLLADWKDTPLRARIEERIAQFPAE